MKVYPNPYHHLDHKGRLAGACPWEPGHAAGARRHVCAELRVVDFKSAAEVTAAELAKRTLSKDQKLLLAVVTQPVQDGEPIALLPSQQDTFFVFDPEGLTVPGGPPWYYSQRAHSGEIFAPRDNRPPMEGWRKARAAAIADWAQRYGEPPDTSTWAQQFPIDAELTTPAGGEK